MKTKVYLNNGLGGFCVNFAAKSGFRKAPPSPGFCPVGLCGFVVLFVVHVWTTTRTETKLPLKINVVPNSGSLPITPVTISTIIDVTQGNTDHERAILQKTRLGVLYEPHPGVKVIYELLTPKN